MSVDTLLITSLKQSFTELHNFVKKNMTTAGSRTVVLAQNLISRNTENSERLQFLTYHKKFIKQNWSLFTQDTFISPFIFYALFKCRPKVIKGPRGPRGPFDAKIEIIKLLKEPEINTFRIYKLLKNEFETVEIQLSRFLLNIPKGMLLTESNKKAVCQITEFIIEKAAQPSVMEERIKKIIPALNPEIKKIALFILSSLESSKGLQLKDIYPLIYVTEPDDICEIFKMCNPQNCDRDYNNLILNVLKTRSATNTKKVCDQIAKIPGFLFDGEQISTTLFQSTSLECLKVLCDFLITIGDVFAEYKLLSLKREVSTYILPSDPENHMQLISFFVRSTFVGSLLEYNEEQLDVVWPELNFSDSQLERICTQCSTSRLYQSALYIIKKLPEYTDRKFRILVSMARKSNKDNGYEAIISREMQTIFDRKELPQLLKHMDKFLAKYVLQNPHWKKEVENNLGGFVSFSTHLMYLDLFMCIDYFQFLLSKLIPKPDDTGIQKGYRNTLLRGLEHLSQRFLSVDKPSVFFEIMESDKDTATKSAALSMLCKWTPSDKKPLIYSRTARNGATILKCFITNCELTSLYKDFLKDIVVFDAQITFKELDKIQAREIIKLIDIYDGVTSLVSANNPSIIDACEHYVNEGKEDILEKLLKGKSISSTQLNNLMLKCLNSSVSKIACLNVILAKARETSGFIFLFEEIKYLESCPTGIHFNCLCTAFHSDDYKSQLYFLYHLLIGLGYKAENNWPQKIKPFGLINPQSVPEATNDNTFDSHLSLLTAIHNNDAVLCKSAIESLSLSDGRLTILYHFLITKKARKNIVKVVYKSLSPEARDKLLLGIYERKITNNTFKKSILKKFEQFLKTNKVSSFIESAWKYPNLLAHLDQIPHIVEILNTANCDIVPLMGYLVKNGPTEVLKAILKGNSKGKISDTLQKKGPTGATWLDLYIYNSEEKTLLILLNALHARGMIEDEALVALLNREGLWGYNELFTRVFSLLSLERRKKVIITWGNEDTSIIIQMVKSNNHELANLVLPLLEDLIPKLYRGISCLVLKGSINVIQYISRENRSIFKKLLPMISEELLPLLMKMFIAAKIHYCCLASIDTKYVKLTPVHLVDSCLEYCIDNNFDKAFTNYLGGLNLSIMKLESLADYALRRSTHLTIVRCLFIKASHHGLSSEYNLAIRLVLLNNESEVIDWMSSKLKGPEAQVHFERLRNNVQLNKLMFETTNETITQYVRALDLTF